MSASAANAQGDTPASGCAGAALRVQALGHSFARTTVLQDIDLEVQAGRNVALVGPSGCGKTTLLRLCAGLLVPRTGCILNTFRHPAFVFQQPCLLPWQTALDNIALGLKAAGMRRGERYGRAHDMAQRMGLGGGDMDKYPHQLSGGMQSRVALARALVLQPDLLLLDEPFSALDIGLKTELYGLLQAQRSSVARHAGEATAVLMITHDLMEAVRLSDCILVMAAAPGRIVQRFEIRQAADLRDDDFVYRSTALLLQDMAVRLAFGLPQAGAAADG